MIKGRLSALSSVLVAGCFKGDLADLPCYLDSDCGPAKCVGGLCGGSAESRPVALAAGEAHTCAVLGNGGVRCWGSNIAGQLGSGKTAEGSCEPPPSQDIDLGADVGEVLQVGASAWVYDVDRVSAHSCALFADGHLKCWGAGADGGLSGWLGYENNFEVLDPASVGFVPLPRSVRRLAVGDRYNCVIYDDEREGLVSCWGTVAKPLGYVTSQNVGDDTDELSTSMPTLEFGDAEIVALSPGYEHACAVSLDGRAWCWGYNGYGELGTGKAKMMLANQVWVAMTYDTPQPVAFAESTKVLDVRAGYYHSCALIEDDKVACWGCNEYHELGVPDDDPALEKDGNCDDNVSGVGTPVLSSLVNEVVGDHRIVQLVSGHSHNCILLDNFSVYCWGDNKSNQLGRAEASGKPVAVEFNSGDDRPIHLASGGSHSCALMRSGEVYCWGDNRFGQLGRGDCTAASTPVRAKI